MPLGLHSYIGKKHCEPPNTEVHHIMGFKQIFTELDDSAREILLGDIEFVTKDTVPREATDIYIEAQKWIEIKKICVVFIDMVKSSQIDFRSHPRTSARIYETFTGSMVRIMQLFDPAYMDIQGDGLLAIFDGKKHSFAKGFVAATTFRTYVQWHLAPRIKNKTNGKVELQTRTGLSYGSVIVKRVGTRSENKQVWAYHRVNQAAKLASIAEQGSLVASDKAYEQLSKIDWIENSCGCNNGETGVRKRLWSEVEKERYERFDPLITSAYELMSFWCKQHGEEYLTNIINHCQFDLPKLKASS